MSSPWQCGSPELAHTHATGHCQEYQHGYAFLAKTHNTAKCQEATPFARAVRTEVQQADSAQHFSNVCYTFAGSKFRVQTCIARTSSTGTKVLGTCLFTMVSVRCVRSVCLPRRPRAQRVWHSIEGVNPEPTPRLRPLATSKQRRCSRPRVRPRPPAVQGGTRHAFVRGLKRAKRRQPWQREAPGGATKVAGHCAPA